MGGNWIGGDNSKCGTLFIGIYWFSVHDNNNNNNNNNTQIAAIALPPSTTDPQLWAELLTFKPKCTIA